MKNQHKFSLGYFLAALALMLVLQFLFAPQASQISYGQFKKYLYEDKIAQVLISDTLIRGTLKPEAVDKGATTNFTVVPVSDPNLVKELEARGVDFRGQYESPFFKMLLSWVLPAVIVVAIWGLPCVV